MILRMILTLVVSLLIVLLMGPKFIPYMQKLHFGQTIYELGPHHEKKQGTPVMGGLMIAAAVVVASVVFHPFSFGDSWGVMLPMLVFAVLCMAVGFADDYTKAVKKRHEGLTPKQKIIGQVGSALAFSVYCYFSPKIGSSIWVPFTSLEWDLGIFYIPLMTLVIIFMVNSSNLQDGLDGLLSTVTAVSMPGWAAVSLFMALMHQDLRQDYLNCAIVALAFTGAVMGFLRFNRYPAKIFMGDTGSMFIGGGVVAISMVLRQPLLMIFLSICPIMSSVSVILQRLYFKATHGKRIFKMSPIHHHFELCGYSETQIVCMYGTITGVATLIAALGVFGGLLG